MPHLPGDDGIQGSNATLRNKPNRQQRTGDKDLLTVYDAGGSSGTQADRNAKCYSKMNVFISVGLRYTANNNGNRQTVVLEREDRCHVMDDEQRVALVEMRTLETAGNDLSATATDFAISEATSLARRRWKWTIRRR